MKRNQQWEEGSDKHSGKEKKMYKGSEADMGLTCLKKKKEARRDECSVGRRRVCEAVTKS